MQPQLRCPALSCGQWGTGTRWCVAVLGLLISRTVPETAQTTDCSYTYLKSSAGQPSANGDGDSNNGAFRVTATITWTVSWLATGVAGGGPLAPLYTSSTVPVRVEQVESVGTVG